VLFPRPQSFTASKGQAIIGAGEPLAEIRPFRGLRYQVSYVRDLATVISPPYDIISPQEQRDLYTRSPYNVVRLEYGVERPSDSDTDNRYTRAAEDLRRWAAEGILAYDERPALYVYDQEFRQRGTLYRRRCLLTRVRLEEWAAGVVRPHESTMAQPKEDRLNLLRTTRANLSPVLALYRDQDQRIAQTLDEALAGKAPAAVAKLGDDRHTLRVIDDEAALGRLAGLFESLPLYVADGHHRYETALSYRKERREARPTWTGDEPENFALLGLTAETDPGLLVLPIHRLVQLPQMDEDPLQTLAQHAAVERVDGGTDDPDAALERLLSVMGERGRSASTFGLSLSGDDRLFLVTVDDAADLVHRLCPDCPTEWRNLDVAVLHFALLGMVLRVNPDPIEEGGTVATVDDAREAYQAVREGRYSAAFLLNAVPIAQVLAIADAGRRMPRKSTFFHPKLATGLVINTLDR
jgi:uncharacterized protein (DUF1015 family)